MDTIFKIDFDKVNFNIRNRYYRYIGSGSGRRVYDLGNGYVIKVAKNTKGIAQNKAEYQISLNDASDLFAKITQVSENFNFLIMEKAERIKDFSSVLKYFDAKSKSGFFRSDKMKHIYSKHDLLPADLCRTSNWGIIKNRPVIIDYGFTRIVKKKYYFPF